MDYVYLIWEDVDDWLEDGGGTYLVGIYANKEDANKECERLNKSCHATHISYFIDKGVVK